MRQNQVEKKKLVGKLVVWGASNGRRRSKKSTYGHWEGREEPIKDLIKTKDNV